MGPLVLADGSTVVGGFVGALVFIMSEAGARVGKGLVPPALLAASCCWATVGKGVGALNVGKRVGAATTTAGSPIGKEVLGGVTEAKVDGARTGGSPVG